MFEIFFDVICEMCFFKFILDYYIFEVEWLLGFFCKKIFMKEENEFGSDN